MLRPDSLNAGNNNLILVGVIGAPYGIKGWCKIFSYLDPVKNLTSYNNLITFSNGSSQELQIDDYQLVGKQLIAKLHDIKDRNAVALFTNLKLYLPKESLPRIDSDSTYYWHDLEGLDVYRLSDKHYFGAIDHLMETGSFDVMVVRNGNKDTLIPFAMGLVVKDVNLTTREILIDWHEDSDD